MKRFKIHIHAIFRMTVVILTTACFMLTAAEFAPVSGNWQENGNGDLSEFSDRCDRNGQPLWAVRPGRNGAAERLSTEISTLDGAGSVYLALRWKNSENFLALRYTDPHRKLQLLRVANGKEHLLTQKENAVPISPQKQPLHLSLETDGNTLTARQDGKILLSAPVESTPGGGAALGCAYRKGIFRNSKLEALPTTIVSPLASIQMDSWRSVFRRDEKELEFIFRIRNCSSKKLTGQSFQMHITPELPIKPQLLPELRPNEEVRLSFLIPGTALKAGTYRAEYQAAGRTGEFDFTLVEPPAADRFDVILWDSIDSSKELSDRGFTTVAAPFFFVSKFAEDPVKYPTEIRDLIRHTQENWAYGISTLLKVDTRRYWSEKKGESMWMRDAQGKPQGGLREVCRNTLEYRDWLCASLHALGGRIADAPNIQYILFDSETENEERKLFDCSHPGCRAERIRAGFPKAPAGLQRTWGMVGVSLRKNAGKQFPDGIVKGSPGESAFLRWWWLDGSGFVESRESAAQLLKKYLPSAKTFHDPILRNPPFHGRDRGMDFVSQWTYANPTPLAIVENIAEMRAAAANPSGAVPNLQLFHYTSEVVDSKLAGTGKKAEQNAVAEARDASHDGRFVTIAPDLLRESVYLSMGQPIPAMMFDGGSAVSSTPGTYANTNSAAAQVLIELSEKLFRPYGSMLKTMMGKSRRTAVLISSTSSLYGGTGNYGNANKTFADVFNTLLLAQLQPDVLYETDLGELNRYEVLFFADNRYLPETAYQALKIFAGTPGKRLIAAPDARPKITNAERFDFPDTSKLDAFRRQQAWINAGKKLKKQLKKGGFSYPFEADSDSVILSARLGDGDAALFAVNDQRTFGNYLGKYGKLPDAGVPQTVSLKFPEEYFSGGRAVYDIATRKRILSSAHRYSVFLGPGEGKWFYAASSPIDAIQIKVAKIIHRGEKSFIHVKLLSAKPLKGTQSVRLTLRDSNGNINPLSGCFALPRGSREIEFIPAQNDHPGFWTVEAEDLIAGHRTENFFEVR